MKKIVGLVGALLLLGIAAVVGYQAEFRGGDDFSAEPEGIVEQSRGGRLDSVLSPDDISELTTLSGRAATSSSGRTAAQGQFAAQGSSEVGDRVIKSAEISLEVPGGEFSERYDRALRVADNVGGAVQSSSTERGGSDDLVSGTITLRVPSSKFDEALSQLKDVGAVTSEQRSSQDVTEEFVDLEARMRHLKRQEAFYLRLMDEAQSIEDMIQVNEQLSEVQRRIEEIQGRLNFLEDRTEFASITARVFEPGAAVASPPTRLSEAWSEAWVATQRVIVGLIIMGGWILPFAIIGLIGWGLLRFNRRRGADVPAE